MSEHVMYSEISSAVAEPVAREHVYVHPGHSFYSERATAVTTILGSCVSVCLFDAVARIGGITHYVLPRLVPGPPGLTTEKIGTTAIVHLFESLMAIGANPQRMRAKVFGGASMQGNAAGSSRDLGGQNAAVAFQVLTDLRVPVIANDTGGRRGRKLVFHTDDGAAAIKYLESSR